MRMVDTRVRNTEIDPHHRTRYAPGTSGSRQRVQTHIFPVIRIMLGAGAISAAIAVAAGAFGAHALRARLPAEDLATFETAVRYQMYHALAMLAVAWVLTMAPDSVPARWAGWLFLAGSLVFSGSLYLLVLTDTRWLGAVTPLGGVAFIAGWLCLAATALRLAPS